MIETETIILGAGPAGLTSGYILSQNDHPFTIIEKDPTYVGGISKTVEHDGYMFDIGGHRFFSKSELINNMWKEMLPNDLLERPRSSKIYYNNKFYSYPLNPLEAFRNMGPVESALCFFSFLLKKIKPEKNVTNFEQWVSNAFGKRLYQIFFKTYSEKVWGCPCTEISSDWASQRIRNLDLLSAITHAFISKHKKPKTLISTFLYPKYGPGQLWTSVSEFIKKKNTINMGQSISLLKYEKGDDFPWIVQTTDQNNENHYYRSKNLVSTVDLSFIAKQLIPSEILPVNLKYRDFIMVALVLNNPNIIDDNWIYIHDPHIKTGRVQNFKSWSPHLIPNNDTSCFGFEYFCSEGDDIWSLTDLELSELAASDLKKISFLKNTSILKSYVIRQKKAYPIYDSSYKTHVKKIVEILSDEYPTLYLAGRNGMHKYNNQDHAMMTGYIAAKNILENKITMNPWLVNEDAEYLEQN